MLGAVEHIPRWAASTFSARSIWGRRTLKTHAMGWKDTICTTAAYGAIHFSADLCAAVCAAVGPKSRDFGMVTRPQLSR